MQDTSAINGVKKETLDLTCRSKEELLGMNVKEKIKIFWKNFTENWLWVTIGVYIGTILMGWILFCIALIFIIKTKDVYHIIKLKNNFPLKLDHLIVFICAMTIAITGLLLVDINSYKYTGKFTYFTIVWLVVVFGGAFIIKHFNILKNKKPN
ncbi:hypothetical protein ES705_07232 [subsurface metagenome]